MQVIIDGYNLIMTSREYGANMGKGMQKARRGLIDDLIRYRKIRRHAITVVFDATEAGGVVRGVEKDGGIRIIFSKKNERADDIIVELVQNTAGIERVVVTSDKAVIRASLRRGAAVISSEGFVEKMEEAIKPEGGEDEEDEDISERDLSQRSRGRVGASLQKL